MHLRSRVAPGSHGVEAAAKATKAKQHKNATPAPWAKAPPLPLVGPSSQEGASQKGPKGKGKQGEPTEGREQAIERLREAIRKHEAQAASCPMLAKAYEGWKQELAVLEEDQPGDAKTTVSERSLRQRLERLKRHVGSQERRKEELDTQHKAIEEEVVQVAERLEAAKEKAKQAQAEMDALLAHDQAKQQASAAEHTPSFWWLLPESARGAPEWKEKLRVAQEDFERAKQLDLEAKAASAASAKAKGKGSGATGGAGAAPSVATDGPNAPLPREGEEVDADMGDPDPEYDLSLDEIRKLMQVVRKQPPEEEVEDSDLEATRLAMRSVLADAKRRRV